MALKAICNYMVICPNNQNCLHATLHIPLYKSQYIPINSPSPTRYHHNNCACRPSRIAGYCPSGIPNDRICIPIDGEAAVMEKIEPIAEIE